MHTAAPWWPLGCPASWPLWLCLSGAMLLTLGCGGGGEEGGNLPPSFWRTGLLCPGLAQRPRVAVCHLGRWQLGRTGQFSGCSFCPKPWFPFCDLPLHKAGAESLASKLVPEDLHTHRAGRGSGPSCPSFSSEPGEGQDAQSHDSGGSARQEPAFSAPEPPPTGLLLPHPSHITGQSQVWVRGLACWCQSFPGNPCHHPIVYPRLAEPRETSPLHGLGHLIMDQSYVCALIAMMVRSSQPGGPFPGVPSHV